MSSTAAPLAMAQHCSVRTCLARIAARLPQQSAYLEAQLLLCEVLDRPRSWLFAHGDETLSAAQRHKLAELASRREGGEPMAYILGRRAFWDFELHITPAVLIPRPETELLVSLGADHLRALEHPTVLDLGTGSGAVAIAIARACPHASVLATDLSTEALSVARRNVRELAHGRVTLHHARWYEGLSGQRFDLVLSNPPYVAADDAHLHAGDAAFEPRLALAAADGGLQALGAIARDASRHLVPGGLIVLEHGFSQGDDVRGLLRDAGLLEVCTWPDLAGLDRVTGARRDAAHAE